MSALTKGGVTVKVLTGRTAAALQRYPESKEEDQEGYLLSATRHCSHDVETQIAEWKAVREEHGTQGARRAPRASHETVDPETGLHASGQRGTHVEYFDGKRNRKRPVHPGEMPTHLRIEPEDLVAEKESEAVHTIYAAGPDLISSDSPEEMERFFTAVKAERDEHYPGIQESMWLERNGKSGLTHVHVASNTTVYRDFEMGGTQYRAGQKMAGDLTRVHDVRAKFEQYLDQNPEHGLQQSLARVGSKEYAEAQRRDGQLSYWEKKRGRESNQDRARRTAYEALVVEAVHDRDHFVEEMRSRGVEVSEKGLRRGKPGKNHDYVYTVAGAKQGVSGKTLGVECSYDAIGAQLDLKALGREIEPPAAKQHSGSARPAAIEGDELDQVKADVEALADRERARRAAERARQAQPALQEAATSYQDALQIEEKSEAELAQQIEQLTEQHGPEMQMRRDELEEMAIRIARQDTPEQREHAVQLGLMEDMRDGTLPLRLQQLHEQRQHLADQPREPEIQQVQRQELAQEHETEQEKAPEQDDVQQPDRPQDEWTRRAEAAPTQPRRLRQVGILRSDQMKDRELIAIVRNERDDGGAYLDLQLAAHDPAARDQAGLYLLASRKKRADGRVGTQTWSQLSATQYAQLQRAAGHNRVEADGRECLALRGNVMPSMSGSGYTVNPATVRPSEHEPIDSDVMERQRASEDAAREKERQRQQAGHAHDDFIVATPERDDGLSL